MAKGWDVLQLFLNNPSYYYSVSDVMYKLGVSWVTANDSMLAMIRLGLLSRHPKVKKYKLNYLIINKTSKIFL